MEACLLLIFFALLIIGMSFPRDRNYHNDLNNMKYQISRIADNLAGIRKELELNRELITELMQVEEEYDVTEDDLH